MAVTQKLLCLSLSPYQYSGRGRKCGEMMGCNCKHAGFRLDSGVMTTDSPRLSLLFPFLTVFLEVNELRNKTSTTSFSQPPCSPQSPLFEVNELCNKTSTTSFSQPCNPPCPLWSSWLTYCWDVCHCSAIQCCIYSEFELFEQPSENKALFCLTGRRHQD